MTESHPKRILFIVQHRYNRSPGQRYRCEQYIQFLEAAGFECTYSPVIANKEEEQALYGSRSLYSKANIFLKSFFRRWKDALRANRYDIIFIYREAFMTGSLFFEKRFKKSGAKMIFDFDDAIWLGAISEANKSLQWLKKSEKVNDIMALSDLVIAGNTYLASHARQFNNNVVIFPSTIDLNYYELPAAGKKQATKDKITIGWSGSHTTIEHFETIIPVLKKLQEKYSGRLRFIVYGDAQYKNEALKIQSIAWAPDTEVSVISSFDIGIMPLPDNEWTRGKCSMKGLQYMGLSVPVVLASVGMNKEVIEDGVNGFLAANDDEWLAKLSLLIENAGLRDGMGKKGRETVELKFSSRALKSRYVTLFQNILPA